VTLDSSSYHSDDDQDVNVAPLGADGKATATAAAPAVPFWKRFQKQPAEPTPTFDSDDEEEEESEEEINADQVEDDQEEEVVFGCFSDDEEEEVLPRESLFGNHDDLVAEAARSQAIV